MGQRETHKQNDVKWCVCVCILNEMFLMLFLLGTWCHHHFDFLRNSVSLVKKNEKYMNYRAKK